MPVGWPRFEAYKLAIPGLTASPEHCITGPVHDAHMLANNQALSGACSIKFTAAMNAQCFCTRTCPLYWFHALLCFPTSPLEVVANE